jgi:hypothetical protein
MAEEMKRVQHDFEDVDPQPVQERVMELKGQLDTAAKSKEERKAKAKKDSEHVC